jgi:hypothetical protein
LLREVACNQNKKRIFDNVIIATCYDGYEGSHFVKNSKNEEETKR